MHLSRGETPAADPGPVVVLTSWHRCARAAAATARAARRVLPEAPLHVLDLDGSYVAGAGETVVDPEALGMPAAELHVRLVASGPRATAQRLVPALHRSLPGGPRLVLEPGVLLLRRPRVLDGLPGDGLAGVVRTAAPSPDGGPSPTAEDLASAGAVHPGLLALGDRAPVPDRTPGRLELALLSGGHRVVADAAALLGPWNLLPDATVATDGDGLLLDGDPVDAVDLTTFDRARPWLLGTLGGDRPRRARLSDHPALARWCAAHADALAAVPAREPRHDPRRLASGGAPDDVVRALLAAAADRAGRTGAPLPPDPLDPAAADAFAGWLTEPQDGGLGRYLAEIHRGRPDLQAVFPGVPGEQTGDFLDWAARHAVEEPVYDAALLAAALEHAVRPDAPRRDPDPAAHGLDVVGFLSGDLGIGESARLMLEAAVAAGIPATPVPVTRHLQSRRRGDARPPSAERHDTVLLCVNADLTGSVLEAVPSALGADRRIGMWYWEVESFPRRYADAARHLDEIWVATDFVRAAVEPHVDIPVRVVTPPLPRALPAPPAVSRADLGLPADRPVVLFTFDYLSTVERKNPEGLVTAFRRAFPRGSGPVLVLKSINAHLREADAERLRVLVADEPDVLLLEQYLDPAARDALVAHADVVASLHRAEGLGLTMAEAMAQGKPVVATRYGGNLQFMDDGNSFLVDCTLTAIPEGAEPYPAGTPWAEPDLDEAARLLRLAVHDREAAARRGARAAEDLRTRHSAAAAGTRLLAALDAVHAAPPRTERPEPARPPLLRERVRRRLAHPRG
ncbi:glycosyltransferase [Cellulomonas hominis]|uniref:glycosyltransferase n=1 Tax=Cellulomonas hominis TaxID=156981 RepID=UPI001C1151D3|nr:glycosyltransferase [Cellulomonas hominis]MBU5424034.1 glycosyltransferase [Cellulomonas hominis]